MKNKKKRLASYRRSLNDGAVMDIQEISAKDSSLEALDQIPKSAYTEVVYVNDPKLRIKENNSSPVNEFASGDKKEIKIGILGKSIEENGVLYSAPFEYVSLNSSGELNKNNPETGECSVASLTNSVDDQIEAKKIIARERNFRKRKTRRKNRKLSRNLNSLSDGFSPSKLEKQEKLAKSHGTEHSDGAPFSENTEELTGELVKEMKTVRRDIRVRKKKTLASDPNSFSDGDLMDIQPVEVLDQSAKAEELMGEVASVIDPKLHITETDLNPVNKFAIKPDIENKGHAVNLNKKLLVLDVNGILTDIVAHVSEEYTPDTTISRKAVFKRPFCDDFLRFCFEKFHVGVWSSRTMRNVKSAVDFLMGDLQEKLLFCWDQTHCTDTGFNTLENREKPMVLKELKKLWEKHEPSLPWEKGDYNESNTLLLDDSPYKALQNPPNTAIFPIPYCYKDATDNSLGPRGDLRVYLEGLASADDVQKYVEANPFGQRAITNGNTSWNFYRKVIHDTSLHTKKIYN